MFVNALLQRFLFITGDVYVTVSTAVNGRFLRLRRKAHVHTKMGSVGHLRLGAWMCQRQHRVLSSPRLCCGYISYVYNKPEIETHQQPDSYSLPTTYVRRPMLTLPSRVNYVVPLKQDVSLYVLSHSWSIWVHSLQPGILKGMSYAVTE